MKKRFSCLLIAVMMVLTMVPSIAFAEGEDVSAPAGVAIDAVNFPDPEFREVISEYDNGSLEYKDVAGDGYLGEGELKDIRSIYLWDTYVEDVTGVKFLTSLERLEVGRCYLTELPELPQSLKNLNVHGNGIKALPANLPPGLEYLGCSDNDLTALPVLPETLKTLYCYECKLKTLPELPAGLTELSCYDNQLTALPKLPDGLGRLECSNNKGLTALPELPANLSAISASDCSLKTLPALPARLTYLNVSDNKLTGVMDISGCKFLRNADFYNNVLTGLKVSPAAKYEYVRLGYNYMSGKSAVTGRTDIAWDDVFYFGTQKTYCEVYGHNYKKVITKAQISDGAASSGSIKYICTKCKREDYERTQYISYPFGDTVKLSTTSYTYNGKSKKPTVKVYDMNGKKISPSNYTVTYPSGRKNVGVYKVTIKYKGAYYTGKQTAVFKIVPKGTTISSLSKSKKGFTVKWKKQSGKMSSSRIDGYEVRYSTSSKMKNAKSYWASGYKKTSAKITKLKAKKKYYVQIRTYKNTKYGSVCSGWSKTKTVKTK